MNSLEATARVIKALETLDVDYMLVGALSSNAYLERWTTTHGTLGLLNQLRDELSDLDLLDEDD